MRSRSLPGSIPEWLRRFAEIAITTNPTFYFTQAISQLIRPEEY